jgi:hypothetical protein
MRKWTCLGLVTAAMVAAVLLVGMSDDARVASALPPGGGPPPDPPPSFVGTLEEYYHSCPAPRWPGGSLYYWDHTIHATATYKNNPANATAYLFPAYYGTNELGLYQAAYPEHTDEFNLEEDSSTESSGILFSDTDFTVSSTTTDPWHVYATAGFEGVLRSSAYSPGGLVISYDMSPSFDSAGPEASVLCHDGVTFVQHQNGYAILDASDIRYVFNCLMYDAPGHLIFQYCSQTAGNWVNAIDTAYESNGADYTFWDNDETDFWVSYDGWYRKGRFFWSDSEHVQAGRWQVRIVMLDDNDTIIASWPSESGTTVYE